MSAKRRLGALNNHLLITENENGSQLEPRGIYNWLTRDNIELRIRMLNFLKARRDQDRMGQTIALF